MTEQRILHIFCFKTVEEDTNALSPDLTVRSVANESHANSPLKAYFTCSLSDTLFHCLSAPLQLLNMPFIGRTPERLPGARAQQ